MAGGHIGAVEVGVVFDCNDGSKVSVRPSGTEPKIKFYIEVHDTIASPEEYDAATAKAHEKIEAIKKDLGI